MAAVDEIKVSELMQTSMNELLSCADELDLDMESVKSTTMQFENMRMALGTSAEMMRDAAELSDDEESIEDDEVQRIVDEALQQSSMALLDTLPVLGNSKPPAPTKKKELSLDELDAKLGKK